MSDRSASATRARARVARRSSGTLPASTWLCAKVAAAIVAAMSRRVAAGAATNVLSQLVRLAAVRTLSSFFSPAALMRVIYKLTETALRPHCAVRADHTGRHGTTAARSGSTLSVLRRFDSVSRESNGVSSESAVPGLRVLGCLAIGLHGCASTLRVASAAAAAVMALVANRGTRARCMALMT